MDYKSIAFVCPCGVLQAVCFLHVESHAYFFGVRHVDADYQLQYSLHAFMLDGQSGLTIDKWWIWEDGGDAQSTHK